MAIRYIACTALLLTASVAQGLWAPPDDRVPTARLIGNLEKQLAAAPGDAHLLARLGRIHSLRYSLGEREVGVSHVDESKNLQLYEQGHGYPSARHHLEGDAIVARINDLHTALDYYERAAKAGPKEAYIWLGLGFVRDEMAHAASYLAWPSGSDEFSQDIRQRVRYAWEDRAVIAYAGALGSSPEVSGGFLTPPVELEAARYIREILEPRARRTRAQKDLLKAAQGLVKQAALRPRAVTPIIFSLDAHKPIDRLLAPDQTVTFDLDGTASGQRWPWVQPDTALLVWDGNGKGDVPSGRQLVGSVTWWLFWEHGYAVLQALDNDGDGWLRGGELSGLAAWRDRNSDGVSDDGEVQPLSALGVRGLAVTVAGHVRGMPMNQRGLELEDGRRLPTYDWIVSPATQG
jgi:hypothetical protein